MNRGSGWKRLFRLKESRRHLNRNIDEELQFHLESRIENLMEKGMDEEEAHAKAYKEFGEIESTRKQLTRIDNRNLRRRSISDTLQIVLIDMKIAIRSYLKQPSFTLTALVIIALGVGATTTIFSVVDGVLIRRLPFSNPDRLVYFDQAAHPVAQYREWEARSTVYSSIGATTEQTLDYTGGERPERLSGVMVTPQVFSILDAKTTLGRMFLPEDFKGMPRVAILSHGAWRRIFGEDKSIIGKTMTLSGHSGVIIGVLDSEWVSPRGLMGAEADIWLPLDVTLPSYQSTGNYILEITARLKPGVSIKTAQVEMDQITVNLNEEMPGVFVDRRGNPREIPIVSLQSALTGNIELPLLLLLGAVALLLAIACANVANLVLARGTDQVHEIGLRFALGASRRRMVGQLLTENTLLSVTGGMIGIVIAVFGVWIFNTMGPADIPMADRIGVDLRVLGFALVLSMLTGIIFGLVPAWRASRIDVDSALKDTSRRMTAGRRKSRLRNTLVVAEIALALVLLSGAGLLFRSLMLLEAVDPGFDIENLIVLPLKIDSETNSEAERELIVQQIIERLSVIPGVERVASAASVPFLHYSGIVSGSFESDFVTDDGRAIEEFTCINPITAGYFSLLSANLRGREFTSGDELSDPIPAVISGFLADLLYPGQEAMGRTFSTEEEGTFRVIGIVSGLHHWGFRQWSRGHVWVPWSHSGAGSSRCTIIVRTVGDSQSLLPVIRDAVWDVEPNLPLPQVFTMSDRISEALVGDRFYSIIFIVFALVAILLAASGIYGSMTYTIGQRRQELGIRTALGADSGKLIRMVVSQGFLLTVTGIAIGLGGALLSAGLLENQVFGISTWDLPTFLSVVILLLGIAVFASYVPARRIVRVNAVEALKQE